MDVEPVSRYPGGSRRLMRRPVAGSIPPMVFDFDDVVDSDGAVWDRKPAPSLLVVASLVLAGLVASAGLGVLVAEIIWNKVYGSITGT